MEPGDNRKPSTDEHARGSFTMRRMTRGQVIALSIAAAVILILLLWAG